MASEILQQELQYIAENIGTEAFRQKTFLVTGATGLVGSVFVKSLLEIEKEQKTGLRVIAFVRNPDKAQRIYEDYEGSGTLSLFCGDVCENWRIEEPVDYVLHAAAVTKSKMMVEHPTEVIRTSLEGMQRSLEFARKKQITKMVYVSSMEMYGQTGEEKASENTLGYLDLASIRSCYPESKRMCECMAKAWNSEFQVPVCTARLAQTFGPGILPDENRVFAQFARSAMMGQDIVLRTEGRSEGNYCYIRDAMTALFTLFLKGKPGEAYNVVNEDTHMQIRDMARLVADKIAGGNIQVAYDIPKNRLDTGYAPDVKLKMDSTKIRSLGWQPEIGLEEAYRRLLRYMKEMQGDS